MKRIRYYFLAFSVNKGTEDDPIMEDVFSFADIPYNDENLALAKRSARNGEYTIEDDGRPEPPPTTEQRVSDLEEQLVQADETAISLYEAQEAQEAINSQQDEALMEIYEMIG